MTAYKGANVTKLDAGGSGDNYIANGYIKTVEKVWIDSYTFTATAIATNDTIAIASIAPGRLITGVEVFFPAITPTTCTINVGTSADTDKFIDDFSLTASPTVARMNNTDGFLYATTGSSNTVIYLSIGITAITAPTAGTIKTVVRYTN